ncbi:hypothetical protein GCM10027599_08540 [Yimella radicis]
MRNESVGAETKVTFIRTSHNSPNYRVHVHLEFDAEAGRRTPRGLIMIVPIFGDEPVGGVDDPAVLRMERAVRASAATPSPVK